MKFKSIFTVAICCVSSIIYCEGTCVYTPQGTAVQVIVIPNSISNYRSEFLADYIVNSYPSAEIVDESAPESRSTIIGSADPKYNCHDYAWSSWRGEAKYWMNDPSAYWTDGSYISCPSSEATHITYYGSGYTLVHSGLYYPTGNYVISKWGQSYLVRHNIDDCPYLCNGVPNNMFYKLNNSIQGDTSIPNIYNGHPNVVRNYVLSNVPTGATVTWNAVHANIISGQGTSSISVRLTRDAVLSATMKNRYNTTVSIPHINISVPHAPIIDDIQIFPNNLSAWNYTLKVITEDTDAFFTWESPYSNGVIFGELSHPEDASFLANPNLFTEATFPGPGSYDIVVRGYQGTYVGDDFYKNIDIY